MPVPEEHHVYFAIVGFQDDHRQVTLLAGVEPDDIWVRGEPFTDTMPEALRRENRWIVSSGLDRFAGHRDHFERLLYKLERFADRLPTLRERYRCGVGVSHFFFMEDPRFYLPAELIERYEELGLDISFEQLIPSGNGDEIPAVLPEILDLPDQEDQENRKEERNNHGDGN